jgi:hypothetical protein
MASAPRVALVSVDPFIFLFPDGRFRSVSWQNSLRQVTGSNKGIGFAIVRGLCRQLKDQGIVYLAGAVPFLFFRFFSKFSSKNLRKNAKETSALQPETNNWVWKQSNYSKRRICIRNSFVWTLTTSSPSKRRGTSSNGNMAVWIFLLTMQRLLSRCLLTLA